MIAVEASAVVPAPREAVFAFLSDLANHFELEERFDLLELTSSTGGASDGGRVRMRGPLGVGRTALTRVVAVESPRRLAGTAQLGRRTRAEVSWTLSEAGAAATLVRLAAEVVHAGALDRVLLAAGGRAWLERRFATLLSRLAQRFTAGGQPGEEPVAASGA